MRFSRRLWLRLAAIAAVVAFTFVILWPLLVAAGFLNHYVPWYVMAIIALVGALLLLIVDEATDIGGEL